MATAQITWFRAEIPTPDLRPEAWTRVVVSTSGGKDSLAALLVALDHFPPKQIEIWHQRIDGDGLQFMDWSVTPRYVQLLGELLGVPVYEQWRVGGFRGELLRQNARPAPVRFVRDQQEYQVVPTRAGINTRRRWPAVSPNLSLRWCSGALKIDVTARALTNDPTLQGTVEKPVRLLFLTGERREESPNRSRYAALEPHRTDSRSRHVLHWRPVIDWTEAEVWNKIRGANVLPHPAYMLGFGRVSCEGCIFHGPAGWRRIAELDPDRFAEIARIEQELHHTIDPRMSVAQKAAMGRPPDWDPSPLTARAREWIAHPERLTLAAMRFSWPPGWYPLGAFRSGGGPV